MRSDCAASDGRSRYDVSWQVADDGDFSVEKFIRQREVRRGIHGSHTWSVGFHFRRGSTAEIPEAGEAAEGSGSPDLKVRRTVSSSNGGARCRNRELPTHVIHAT